MRKFFVTSYLVIILSVAACGVTSDGPETPPGPTRVTPTLITTTPINPTKTDQPPATATPGPYLKSGSGTKSFELQMSCCNCLYEDYERIELEDGDRLEVSVTSEKSVSVSLKLPDATRLEIGEPDRIHDIVYPAKITGRHTIIIASAFNYIPSMPCQRRITPVDYDYTIYSQVKNSTNEQSGDQ